MTTSSTTRVRRHRERRKSHLAPLRVEVPLEALSERLVADGALREWDADDKQMVAKAVQKLLAAYLASSM
jgi:hypothetical protein